jgi:GrpB-like predicted nucleotidyltransferase (UPF0157 family)
MTNRLDSMTNEELGRLFPVTISDPNPDWLNLFEIEKDKIVNQVGIINITRIEHIGSTAVPDLPAKPVIDILLEVTDTADISILTMKLKRAGYHCIPKPENPPPHLMFVRGYTLKGFSGQVFHIHVRYSGDQDEIIFRDYLIQHPGTAEAYACLKIKLAEIYKNDRERYTENKGEFIRQVLTSQKKEKHDEINEK